MLVLQVEQQPGLANERLDLSRVPGQLGPQHLERNRGAVCTVPRAEHPGRTALTE